MSVFLDVFHCELLFAAHLVPGLSRIGRLFSTHAHPSVCATIPAIRLPKYLDVPCVAWHDWISLAGECLTMSVSHSGLAHICTSAGAHVSGIHFV
jgi:hypothetical protein